MSDSVWALVVEADARSLITIGALLADLGVFYKRNTTGAQVVEKVEAMYPRPNFVLLDLELPRGDAFSIVRELKQRPHLSGIPVIAISDDTSHVTSIRARSAGFNAFIAKPLPRRRFGALLDQVLRGQPVWQLPM